ncbi:MAG TPA: YciI family protein [Kiloniellales bacterium]|nr:YciI family protein [Kiloniellales bacterium]
MKVMVMVLATADSEAGMTPGPEMDEMFRQMGAYNEELVKAGIMQMGEGLKPTSSGVRITFDGQNRTARHGPFPLDESTLAGFWIWEVKSMDEAIAWAKRCPNPMPGPSQLEIRPFYEAADFAELAPKDVLEQEEKLRKKMEKRK